MFKRSKKKINLANLPPPPNMDEILSDLETFNMEPRLAAFNSIHLTTDQEKVSPKSPKSLDEWWQQFEHVMHSHEQLKILQSEIENYKCKLEARRTELHKEALALEQGVEQNLTILENALTKDSCSDLTQAE